MGSLFANSGGAVDGIVVTRRYQVQLALGLMTQEKLIPTKYMASQLAIELSKSYFLLTRVSARTTC